MVEPISEEQAMQEGFDMQNLLNTPGWQIVRDEAGKRIQVAMNALAIADASKTFEVMELQHQIKALRWLLDWPVLKAAEAQAIEKELAGEHSLPDS